MNNAIELCKELYELSGWDESDFDTDCDMKWHMGHKDEADYKIAPDYALEPLLLKLPDTYKRTEISLWKSGNHTWRAGYGFGASFSGDTPKNAVYSLAIELFKQGVLTK